MDHDPGPYLMPDGSRVLVVGNLAIESSGPERRAICRRCGSMLARWRAGEARLGVRCACSEARP